MLRPVQSSVLEKKELGFGDNWVCFSSQIIAKLGQLPSLSLNLFCKLETTAPFPAQGGCVDHGGKTVKIL